MLGARQTGFDSVPRRDLVDLVAHSLTQTGIAFICAPFGYGKSSLAAQCIEGRRLTDAKTRVHLIDRLENDAAAFLARLEEVLGKESRFPRSLVVIDELPPLNDLDLASFVSGVDLIVSKGGKVIVTLEPSLKYAIQDFPESFCVDARMLAIDVRDFSQWTSFYGLRASQEVFEKTKGIPLLIASYSYDFNGAAAKILTSFFSENLPDEVRVAGLTCLLLHRGYIDGSLGGWRGIKPDVIHLLSTEYPYFGINYNEGAFSSLQVTPALLHSLGIEGIPHLERLIEECALQSARSGQIDNALRVWFYDRSRSLAVRLIAEDPIGVIENSSHAFCSPLFSIGQHKAFSRASEALVAVFFALRTGDRRLYARASRYVLEHVDELEADCRSLFALVSVISGASRELGSRFFSLGQSEQGIALPSHQKAIVDIFGKLAKDPDPALVTALTSQILALDTLEISECEKNILRTLGAIGFALAGKFAEGYTVFMRYQTCSIPRTTSEAALFLFTSLLGFLTSVPRGAKDEPSYFPQAVCEFLSEKGWRDYLVYAKGFGSLVDLPYPDGEQVDAYLRAQSCASRRGDYLFENVFLLVSGYCDILAGEHQRADIRLRTCGGYFKKVGCEYLIDLAELFEGACSLETQPQKALDEKLVEPEKCYKPDGRIDVYGIVLQLVLLSALEGDARSYRMMALHRQTLLNPLYKRLLLCLYVGFEKSRQTLSRVLTPDLIEDVERRSAQHAVEGFERRSRVTMGELTESPVSQALEIKLFGGFDLIKGGVIADSRSWEKRKAMFLVAYLALNCGKEVTRSELMNELFPDIDYSRARTNLYSVLSSARKALGQTKEGPEYIVCNRDVVRLNPKLVTTDIQKFELLSRVIKTDKAKMSTYQLLDLCSQLEKVYRGDLTVFAPDTNSVFETSRGQFKTDFLDAMSLAAAVALDEGDRVQALYFARICYRYDSVRDDVCESYMKALAMNAQRTEALSVYFGYMRYQTNELGLSPSPRMSRLYEDIIEGAMDFSKSAGSERLLADTTLVEE